MFGSIVACILLFMTAPQIVLSDVEMSIVWNDVMNVYSMAEGKRDNFVSHFHFKDAINQTGWSYLEVTTNPIHSDLHQAYTAGFGEGLITSYLIDLHFHNTIEGTCVEPLSVECRKLKYFVDTNAAWIQHNIDELADSDPYWHQVRLFFIQLQGLIDGYKATELSWQSVVEFRYKPDITGILMLQIMYELGDVAMALKLGSFSDALPGLDSEYQDTNSRRLNRDEETSMLQIAADAGDLAAALKMNSLFNPDSSDRCTSLVKLTPGNEDLYTAHNTFSSVSAMLRILKRYTFGFHLTPGSGQLIPGYDSSFSSYPGVLLSLDDFYIISSGIVAVETTTQNYNDALWKNIKPVDFVFEGIRNVVANRLATSARQWCEIFAQFNSGTYNNQWTIVDYKKFVPGAAELQSDLIWLLEQLPGAVRYNDVTEVLRSQTYFGSYNIPYNDYKNDPLSRCNCTPPYSAENAMSVRGDLNPPNGTYPFSRIGHRDHVGYDTKLTTYEMMKNFELIAISSPTYDQQPPFQWSKSDLEKTVRHVGHPDVWKFEPVHHKWRR